MAIFLICLLAGFLAAVFAVSACMIAARADERMAAMSHQPRNYENCRVVAVGYPPNWKYTA